LLLLLWLSMPNQKLLLESTPNRCDLVVSHGQREPWLRQ